MVSTVNIRAGASGPGNRIGNAIASASARTGVDFDYLMNQARIESSFDPNARARTSSATGLYQFIDQTWLGTVKDHGAKHGLGWAADAIHGRSGRYSVPDAETRRAILDLRNHPEAASAMAAEFASDNRDYLEARLGRPMESVDLYLAHFLGAGGAEEFLGAYAADPSTPAASILPAAARANRSIFYRPDGSARSVAEIRDNFAAKLGTESGPSFAAPQYAAMGATLPMPAAPHRFTHAAGAEEADRGIRPIAKPSAEFARISYEMLSKIGASA
ncbi:transglycosylase SLT domain-containing protein [Allosphingosinicella vermicomposti]|uniref:transglycosylase SLT domain-containing protein n=1 Tax=Allosphingosinicella vermicomposti TaxID=614671 RepID=UPI000D0F37E3|nr:transglycosylase SLT domain-containing protein [Allosphingosinicella vermicomposti]